MRVIVMGRASNIFAATVIILLASYNIVCAACPFSQDYENAPVKRSPLPGRFGDRTEKLMFEWGSVAYKLGPHDHMAQVENVICNVGQKTLIFTWLKANLGVSRIMEPGFGAENSRAALDSVLTEDRDAPIKFNLRTQQTDAAVYSDKTKEAENDGQPEVKSRLGMFNYSNGRRESAFRINITAGREGAGAYIKIDREGPQANILNVALNLHEDTDSVAEIANVSLRTYQPAIGAGIDTQWTLPSGRFAVFGAKDRSSVAFGGGETPTLRTGIVLVSDFDGNPLIRGEFSYYGRPPR